MSKVIKADDALPIGRKLSPVAIVRSYLEIRSEPGVPRWFYQPYIDNLLRQIVEGKDPRVVFQNSPKRKKGQRDPRTSQQRCLEVLRLADEVGEPKAKKLVADAFGREVKSIENDLKKWRETAVSHDWVSVYVHNLRAKGHLPKK